MLLTIRKRNCHSFIWHKDDKNAYGLKYCFPAACGDYLTGLPPFCEKLYLRNLHQFYPVF